MKAEVKQLFVTLTVNAKKELNKFQQATAQSPPTDLSNLERIVASVSNAYSHLREELNSTKQRVLLSLNEVQLQVREMAATSLKSLDIELHKYTDGIQNACAGLQKGLQDLIRHTDNFETINAKNEGVANKLLYQSHQSWAAGSKVNLTQDAALAKERQDASRQIEELRAQLTLLAEALRKREMDLQAESKARQTDWTRFEAERTELVTTSQRQLAMLQEQMMIQTEEEEKLLRLIQEREQALINKQSTIAELQASLTAALLSSERQAIHTQEIEARLKDRMLQHRTYIVAIHNFFNAMKLLEEAVTQGKTEEAKQAKRKFDHTKSVVHNLLLSPHPHLEQRTSKASLGLYCTTNSSDFLYETTGYNAVLFYLFLVRPISSYVSVHERSQNNSVREAVKILQAVNSDCEYVLSLDNERQ